MKILQWLFSSFFRTIGRTIAILVMGGLLYYILSINGIGISDLFLDNVKADELYKGAYYMGHISGWSTSFNSYNRAGLLTNYNYDDTITYPNTFNENNVSKITIDGFFYNLQTPLGIDTITCNNNSLGYCTQWNINDNYTLSFKLWITDEAYPCQISFDTMPNSQNADYIFWTATCPYDLDFNRVKYHIYVYGMNNSGVQFGINENIHYYTTEGQAIINNQNQNTQDIIQQQQNATQQLLDDNTTQADNTGKDFITNFSNNTHGLTGIITAPLNAIQSLSSATCTPLILPLPFTDNKTLTLPCMNTIYSQYFGAFYTMYQGIILGLISYWVCVRIFGLAKGFKDPEDDKIEVVDL